MKFKIGQKVRVVNCYSGGNFYDGDIVEIVQIGTDDGEDENCYGAISPHDNYKWYLYEDEVGPVTNRDKINSMTNEEFARFYLSNSDEYCDCCIYNWRSCEGEDCHTAMVKWLNSPVKEGKNNG